MGLLCAELDALLPDNLHYALFSKLAAVYVKKMHLFDATMV